jgi:hypothetical protein
VRRLLPVALALLLSACAQDDPTIDRPQETQPGPPHSFHGTRGELTVA